MNQAIQAAHLEELGAAIDQVRRLTSESAGYGCAPLVHRLKQAEAEFIAAHAWLHSLALPLAANPPRVSTARGGVSVGSNAVGCSPHGEPRGGVR